MELGLISDKNNQNYESTSHLSGLIRGQKGYYGIENRDIKKAPRSRALLKFKTL